MQLSVSNLNKICSRAALLLVGSSLLILTIIAAFTPEASASQTPTFIQEKNSYTPTSKTVNLSFPSTHSGNLIVAYVVWNNTSPVTLTDSAGNAYTSVSAATTFGQWNNISAQVFYAKDIAGGPTTVTATFANVNTGSNLYIVEYAGLDKTNPLHQTTSNKGYSRYMNSGSVLTTTPDTLLFSAGAKLGGSLLSIGNGYTLRTDAHGNVLMDKRTSNTGSYDAAATLSKREHWVMQVVAFKAASDSTAPSTPAGLTATSSSDTQIDLQWNASTDNTGVTGYTIYRNGTPVGTTSTTSYQDAGLQANTTYNYTVDAHDAAGNTSVQSSPATATTAAEPSYDPLDRLFTGDFETGNFHQWPVCQSVALNSYCAEYNNNHYSLGINTEPKRQGNYSARFELRDGDIPFGSNERTEVQGDGRSGGNEGDERWYQWSTQFDSQFPMDHASQGWGLVTQWHDQSSGSPPVGMYTDVGNGEWGLRINKQSSPGNFVSNTAIWKGSLSPGTWQDIKLHIKWSALDSVGYVEMWHNGVAQTFTGAPCAGETRCYIRTLTPGGGGTYFKQGIYRCGCVNGTAVVYHDGFTAATTETGLGSPN